MVVTSAANFLVQPLVFPIGVAFVTDKNFHAFLSQLARARNKVRMDVSFGHGNNTQAVGRRDHFIAIHIAFGINHNCLARALTTDYICGLGQFVVIHHS